MEKQTLKDRVVDTLRQIAFTPATGSAVGHQVRCLELLAKLLGMYEDRQELPAVNIVEDL